jgi:hypothetical protein
LSIYSGILIFELVELSKNKYNSQGGIKSTASFIKNLFIFYKKALHLLIKSTRAFLVP